MNIQAIENTLWGLFISDAISMPAHWYYKLKYLKQEFGTIHGYNNAPHPHPESFMVGNSYFPDIEKANKYSRKYDILHKHIKFYNTSYNHLHIDIKEHAGEHANAMPTLQERYHYHHGLQAGENTLGANLVRVLMRSVISTGEYRQEIFLNDFVEFMTTAGRNNDPYTEIYIRRWFENYSKGIAAELCAEQQKSVWSIGSHGGIIRPLVLSLMAKDPYQGLGHAINHQNLTHRSENVSSALGVLVPLLQALFQGHDPMSTLKEYASKVQLIDIKGETLSKIYQKHKGPGNIPKDEMYKIHTTYSNEHLDLDETALLSDEQLIGSHFSTACYPEHGLPLLFSLLYRNKMDFTTSILSNANAGGDNVHRGMILGMIAGARSTEIPNELQTGLKEYTQIKSEIEAFVKIISTSSL